MSIDTDAAFEPPIFVATMLMDACEDDDESRAQILGLFLDQATVGVGELVAAVAAGDREAVTRAAHDLTGSSAAVGALRLADVSRRLSEAARTGRLDEGAALPAELERSLESTRAILDPG